MSDGSVEITNNQAGNIAGRDIVINNNQNKSEYLQCLYDKFREEQKNNPAFSEIIEELNYYNSAGPLEMVGLDKKLENGNRSDVIWYAKEIKEKFHKKLHRTSQFSETTQKINVYLLAAVRTCFMQEVYPLILASENRVVVDSAINERIIAPLVNDLGENLLGYDKEDIQGMLYFLTGNCHLKWN
jgi:hypothetical protein